MPSEPSQPPKHIKHRPKSPETKRNKVIAFIREIVKKCLGCDAYLTGSYPTKTHLPDGDIDMTACICYSQEDTWYSILLDALCKSIQVGSGSSTTPTTVGGGGEGGGERFVDVS